MDDILVPKSSKKFECKTCDFVCSRKSQYNRHLSTRKHIENDKRVTSDHDLVPKSSNTFECECGNTYKYRQGLYKPRKTCCYIVQGVSDNVNNKSSIFEVDKELLVKMLLKNQDVM